MNKKKGKIVVASKNKLRILKQFVFIILVIIISVIITKIFLQVNQVDAQKDEKTTTYTMTVRDSSGKVRTTLENVVSHSLIPEENAIFMSVILKDGRRFLLALDGKDFEFSKELSKIIEENLKSSNQEK